MSNISNALQSLLGAGQSIWNATQSALEQTAPAREEFMQMGREIFHDVLQPPLNEIHQTQQSIPMFPRSRGGFRNIHYEVRFNQEHAEQFMEFQENHLRQFFGDDIFQGSSPRPDPVQDRTFPRTEPPSSDWICPICLENTHSPNENHVVELPCNHHFHGKCVSRWFSSHSQCPVCRADMNNQSRTEPVHAVPLDLRIRLPNGHTVHQTYSDTDTVGHVILSHGLNPSGTIALHLTERLGDGVSLQSAGLRTGDIIMLMNN